MRPNEVLIQNFLEYYENHRDDLEVQGNIKIAFVRFIAEQTMNARKLKPKIEVIEEETEEPPIEVTLD